MAVQNVVYLMELGDQSLKSSLAFLFETQAVQTPVACVVQPVYS